MTSRSCSSSSAVSRPLRPASPTSAYTVNGSHGPGARRRRLRGAAARAASGGSSPAACLSHRAVGVREPSDAWLVDWHAWANRERDDLPLSVSPLCDTDPETPADAALAWHGVIVGDGVIVGWLIAFAVCGLIAGFIGSSKNRSGFGSFLLGFLLGVIGIIIVAVLPSGTPPAPIGMLTARCQRCNAVQNVPAADPTFECWQCKQANTVPDDRWAAAQRRNNAESTREWLDRVKRRDDF